MEQRKKEQFCEVVQASRKKMYRVAYRILQNQEDAKDAVGEAIVKAYEKIDLLRNEDRLEAWIMQIVLNVSKNMRIKRSREVYGETEKILKQREVWDYHDELWDIIEKMPPKYGDVLHLFYYEEYTMDEISEILDVPVGTVKSRLNRGKERLKKLLKDI